MNAENNKWKFIIPAILLILPVVLILIFDPAAWLSRYNLVSDILGTVFFADVPIAMCLWHWFKPEHFREWRWMIPFGLMTLGSWAIIAGGMWIDCWSVMDPKTDSVFSVPMRSAGHISG